MESVERDGRGEACPHGEKPPEPAAFQCQGCGNCCRWPGYVRLSADEIDAIAGYLRLDEHVFLERYTRLTADRRGLSLIENADSSCIFLETSDDGRSVCAIHAVKPAQCRDFPRRWNFPGWESECAGGRRERQKENGEA